MAADEGSRKLTTILAADVAGYSRLMGDDERATVMALKEARTIFRERVDAHAGRLIDATGDSILAEFKSVVEEDMHFSLPYELDQEIKKRGSL